MTWPVTVLIVVAAIAAGGWIALNRWHRWQQQLLTEATAAPSRTSDVVLMSSHSAQTVNAETADQAGVGQAGAAPQLTLQRPAASPVLGATARTDETAANTPTSRPSAPNAPAGQLRPAAQNAMDTRWWRWGFAAAAALLAVGAVAVIGERPALLAYVYLSAVLVPLLVCDVRLHRLPTCFIAPAYSVVAAALLADAAVTGEWTRLRTAALGMLILGGVYLALCLMPGGLMGLGDVRLAGVLGATLAWVSWDALLAGALGAFVLSFLVGVPRLLLRRTRLQTRVAFGPYMLISAALAVVASV